MNISGLNIRLRIFVHWYLEIIKQNSDAWDNGESKKGKRIRKNVRDLKEKNKQQRGEKSKSKPLKTTI